MSAHNRHSVDLLAGVESVTRPNREPAHCDGGELPVDVERTWWVEDIRLARCEGCGEAVGTYVYGGRVWTQPHLRTDLSRP